MRLKLDTMTLAGIGILLLFSFQIIRGWAGQDVVPAAGSSAVPVPAVQVAAPQQPELAAGGQNPQDVAARDAAIAPPYDAYFLTQGPHGQSYGHYAIDIAAGKGTPIKSPINGTVTQLYVDEWGNTIIVIENSRYTVTLYHGDYTAVVGDVLALGQPIGFESNHGYTLDVYGNLCTNRDCGYHTHLNIFDKQQGANVDPLTLIPASLP